MPNFSNYLKIQVTGIASLLVVLYAIGDYLLLPTHLEHAQAQQQLAELNLRTTNLRQNLVELQKCQQEYDELHRQLDECYDALESSSLDPLEWLHNVSERSGIQIKSFQDRRHDIVNSLPAVEIDMKAHGNYQEVCDFLHFIERSSRPCFIQHLKISPKNGEIAALEVEARILVFPVSNQFQKLLHDSKEPALTSASTRLKTGEPAL